MTSKERVHAALEGGPVDRFPVTSLYNMLYYMDHFEELTGEPQWRFEAWCNASPEGHMALYREMMEKVPFELLQPVGAREREWRERQEFVLRGGEPFRHDTKTDEWSPLAGRSRSGHAFDDKPVETQAVFDRKDADERITVTKAEDAIAAGLNDYLDATVAEFGADHFVVSGGVVGPFYSCSWHVGFTNLLAMVIEAPDLIEYLCQKILEQNVETIRRLAAAGGDAIYIDDAVATSDMISVAHYERFCLPYMKSMIDEVHGLGHKAIAIYFGGIADRLEQIASTGADGLLMEASMKGYVNDIGRTVEAIGERVTPFGNIDPVGCIQNGTDEELESEIRRQAEAGARARGFVISNASPITPSTPLARVQRFIGLGKEIGAEVCAAEAS